MPAITLVGAPAPPINVLSVRMVTPWNGNWIADLELDPDVPLLPAGPVVLTIGLIVLKGVIDSSASGTFGPKASARIVGGMLRGWDAEVIAQPFVNDAGVLSSVVIAAAGAQVGEVAAVASPKSLGPNYVLAAGPARRVLDGEDWHVDPLTGTTIVAPRIAIPANPLTTTVLDFDPIMQRATIAADGLLSPGMILIDPRFGMLTIRDVEQMWSANGQRANAWCGSSVTSTRLAGALQRLAYEAVGATFLRSYRCRVVLQAPDGRLAVQPIEFGELNPVSVITLVPIRCGIPGVTVKVTPGSECILEFAGGDPSRPIVTGFDDTASISLELDGASVALGPGALPLAPGPWAAYLVTALGTFASAIVSGSGLPGPTATAAGNLVTALLPTPSGLMPLPTTLVAKGA